MTTTDHTEILDRLARQGILPVITVETPDDAVHAVTALKRAGVVCVEITLRTAAAEAAIERVKDIDGICVGAGTVLSPELARSATRAGAQFALAPGLNPAVVQEASALGLPFFPGVATPSEIEHARLLGVRTVKVFPALTVGGTAFLRAVSATYPDMRYIPTGGISHDSYREYLQLSSVLAVGGTWLTPPALLREARYPEIEKLAAEALAGRA